MDSFSTKLDCWFHTIMLSTMIDSSIYILLDNFEPTLYSFMRELVNLSDVVASSQSNDLIKVNTFENVIFDAAL